MEVDVLPSTNAADQMAFTSSGNDLLSVTNAAVTALSKDTLSSPESRRSVRYAQSDTAASPQVISPLSSGRRAEGSPRFRMPPQPQRANSTDIQHDESVLSRRSMASDRSIEHSTFLHGKAQLVKVSAKKLREIKSPFDAHVQSSYDSMLKESPDSTLKESPGRKSSVEQVELSSTFGSTGAAISKRIAVEKHIVPPQLRPHPDNNTVEFMDTMDRGSKHINTITGEVTDSGFVTQNVQVIREVRGESHSQNTSASEVPSLDEYVAEERIIRAHHHEGKFCMCHLRPNV